MDVDEIARELFPAVHRQHKILPKIKGLEQISVGDMTVFGAMMKSMPEKDGEGIALGILNRHLCMSPPALSQSINRLEDKGLIKRIFSSKNRRMTYVAFTEKGKQIYHRERKHMDAVGKEIVARMGVENAEELIRLTNRFHDVLEELISEQKATSKDEG